ncbi:heavy metal-associated domain-containing protein, partial [Brevundimonas sp.]
MRTTTIDVSGFRTPLDPLVIEKHLRGLKGVLDAAANFGSATATVRYDEARLSQAELEQAVRDCGFHCRGEVVPRHVCVPNEDAVDARASHPHPPAAPAAAHGDHAARR